MGRPFSSYFELQLVSQSRALSTLTMASTRSSQSASPGPKGTKRAADASSSPPAAKRGRGRPKKVQKTLEETMEGTAKDNDIEDDAEVAKQIDRDTASSSPGPAKRGRGRPKKAQDTSKNMRLLPSRPKMAMMPMGTRKSRRPTQTVARRTLLTRSRPIQMMLRRQPTRNRRRNRKRL